ncbi:MAG: glycine zipper 2TM domain-containing protein [Alteromonadaceae bacterium]|nr:glycine zipper 2TM domain-containing protein [Alteromonadaceae bacterium]
MKVLINTILALVIYSISASANAAHQQNSVFYKKADVIKATPIYKRVTVKRPVYGCQHNLSSRHYHHKNALATVLGATIGGVIGHKIFKKSRLKHVGTIAGAVVGGAIGHDIGTRHRTTSHRTTSHRTSHHNHHTSCVSETEVIKKLMGYRVTYRYQGELFTTRTKQHPGKRINIKIQVEAI